jgi:Ricin-type beta-trefoil lectin domain/Fibronectin type III domain
MGAKRRRRRAHLWFFLVVAFLSQVLVRPSAASWVAADVSSGNSLASTVWPNAPASVTVSPIADTAVVSWAVPASNGVAITGYQVTAVPTNTSLATVTCTPSPATNSTCTLTGLVEDAAYSTTVAARNAGIYGPASVPVSFTSNSVFALVNNNSGRCLDDPGGQTGIQLQIWDCSANNPNQTITQMVSGELRILGQCLASNMNSNANGTALILWPCNGQTGQLWTINANGTITNPTSGRAFSIPSVGTANGSPVNLWSPIGNLDQYWTVT